MQFRFTFLILSFIFLDFHACCANFGRGGGTQTPKVKVQRHIFKLLNKTEKNLNYIDGRLLSVDNRMKSKIKTCLNYYTHFGKLLNESSQNGNLYGFFTQSENVTQLHRLAELTGSIKAELRKLPKIKTPRELRKKAIKVKENKILHRVSNLSQFL